MQEAIERQKEPCMAVTHSTPRRAIRACAALLLLLGALGCNQYSPVQPAAPLAPPKFDAAKFPPLDHPVQLEAGVFCHQVAVEGNQVWIYLPTANPAPASLPCVLIAPAGTDLTTGIRLEDGDRVEHLPYVRAG